MYHGQECEIRTEHDDGTVTLVALNGNFARQDRGWERVDKFEWEKRVQVTEIATGSE